MKKYIVNRGYQLPPGLLGNCHRYESDKGIISMLSPCFATLNQYEIYCVVGDLFDDDEKYTTLEAAEERIIELIGDDFKFGR